MAYIELHTNNDIQKLLIGNKSDLIDQRTISYEKGKVCHND